MAAVVVARPSSDIILGKTSTLPRKPPVEMIFENKPTEPPIEIPEWLIDAARVSRKAQFDPKEHLNFKPPERILTFRDFGIEDKGISPNAVSEPFSLFTEEAIRQMRAEVFSKPILDSCQVPGANGMTFIRGHCPK